MSKHGTMRGMTRGLLEGQSPQLGDAYTCEYFLVVEVGKKKEFLISPFIL